MSVLGQALGQQKPKKRNFFYPTIDPRAIPPLLEGLRAAGDMEPRNDIAAIPENWEDVHFQPLLFAEPCAGAGDLIQLLEAAGLECAWGLELEPQDPHLRNRWPIGVGDALHLTERDLRNDLGPVDLFISNLPWERSWLEPLIWHLAALRPLWSLHDAGWAYNAASAPFRAICTDVVAIGRLKWFPARGRPLRLPREDYAAYRERARKHMKPSDPPTDCAWYRFDARPDRLADVEREPTRFHFRSVPREGDGRQGRLL